MKSKLIQNDFEMFVDPTPLTKEEKIALSKFIQEHKEKNKIKSKRKLVA